MTKSNELLLTATLGIAAILPYALPTTPLAAELRPSSVAVEAAESERVAGLLADDIRSQFARRMKSPETEFSVRVESLRIDGDVDLGQVTAAKVMGLGSLGATRLEGLFSAPVALKLSSGEREVTAVGVLHVTGPVFVARLPLPRGHVVTKEDLAVTRLPWRGLPTASLGLGEGDLVGARIKSLVSSGAPLQTFHLDEPLAVRAGESVELTVISGPGVLIKSRAVARQEGKVGDIVRVEQPDTKKMLTGQITADKTVEIRL